MTTSENVIDCEARALLAGVRVIHIDHLGSQGFFDDDSDQQEEGC